MDLYLMAAEDLELVEERRRAELRLRLAEQTLDDCRRAVEDVDRRIARARLRARVAMGR